MSTRSIVAIRTPGDHWRGRYVHFDGYPGGVDEGVRAIIKRDGVTAAVQTLLFDHYGWSSVTGEQEQTLSEWNQDGRFEPVPGYGIAYTTEQGQSSPDEWHIDGDTETWCEYVHIIENDGTVTTIEL